jgi:hypothetical protein
MRVALVVLVASCLVAGCGVASGNVQRTADESVTHGEACSFAVAYRSLAQLRYDATAVAVVQPTGVFHNHRLAGLPSRDAQVRVLVRVAGRQLPSTLVVEDVADPRIDGSDSCGPVLAKGNTYLLYLTAVKRRPRGPSVHGRYFVVGGPQGAWAHPGPAPPGERARAFVHQQSDVGQSLPKRISVAQARRS